MSNQPESQADIQSTLNEQRIFPPPAEFSAKARIKSMADYERLYEEADRCQIDLPKWADKKPPLLP